MNGYVALMLLPVLLVFAVLVIGVVSFARGGAWYERNANKLMRLRVGAQFVAVIVVVLIAYLARG